MISRLEQDASLGGNGSDELLTLIAHAYLGPGVGLGFLALAALLTWIAIARALKPVQEIGRVLAERASDDFTPIETAAPREIAPLIDAINDFIERLRLTLDTSQQFIAEAAHRIRTPLAALKAQAEVALKVDVNVGDPVVATPRLVTGTSLTCGC